MMVTIDEASGDDVCFAFVKPSGHPARLSDFLKGPPNTGGPFVRLPVVHAHAQFATIPCWSKTVFAFLRKRQRGRHGLYIIIIINQYHGQHHSSINSIIMCACSSASSTTSLCNECVWMDTLELLENRRQQRQ